MHDALADAARIRSTQCKIVDSVNIEQPTKDVKTSPGIFR